MPVCRRGRGRGEIGEADASQVARRCSGCRVTPALVPAPPSGLQSPPMTSGRLWGAPARAALSAVVSARTARTMSSRALTPLAGRGRRRRLRWRRRRRHGRRDRPGSPGAAQRGRPVHRGRCLKSHGTPSSVHLNGVMRSDATSRAHGAASHRADRPRCCAPLRTGVQVPPRGARTSRG